MYTEQTDRYDAAVKEAIGDNVQAYTEKLAWLQNQWKRLSKNDCAETRLVAPMILQVEYTSAINVAIIADNLAYFQKHVGNDRYDLETALAKACLCGSRRIAEFLLQQFHSSFTTDKHDYLLGHVAVSMQQDWMKEIAVTIAQAKRPVPSSIYQLADKNTIHLIRDIFATGSLPANKPKV